MPRPGGIGKPRRCRHRVRCSSPWPRDRMHAARRRRRTTTPTARRAQQRRRCSTIASNTGCTSVGELLMTLQDLGGRGLPLQRLLGLVEQAHVLDRDHRLVGEGLQQRRSACRRTAPARARVTMITPIDSPSRSMRHAEHGAVAAELRRDVARMRGTSGRRSDVGDVHDVPLPRHRAAGAMPRSGGIGIALREASRHRRGSASLARQLDQRRRRAVDTCRAWRAAQPAARSRDRVEHRLHVGRRAG